MPIKKCTLPEGGSGYKYGDSGKCYKNRKDAIKQMKAIKWRESQGSEDWDIEKFLEDLRTGKKDVENCCKKP